MNDASPLSSPEPWTLVAEGYARESQPALVQYGRAALELVGYRGGGRVLDLACGPGTLSLLVHQDALEVHAVDLSPGMLACLERELARRGIANVRTRVMDGQALAFEDERFDWAVSIFGVPFFADPARGLREMHRVLRPGGRAAVTAWAPRAHSSLMQAISGAIDAAFARSAAPPAARPPSLEDPDVLAARMRQAGFTQVAVAPFDGLWPVDDVERFLDSMVQGSAPIAWLRRGLDEAGWAAKRAVALAHLEDVLVELPTTLSSRAWIATGSKPAASHPQLR